MNLEEIAEHLESKGKGIMGKSIFVNEMPDSCSRGIMLMNRSGAPIDHEMRGYFNSEFMVIIRATEYTDGANFAREVLKTLTRYDSFNTKSMEIKQLLPQSTPRDYRRQVSGFFEYEFDVTIMYGEL